MRKRHRCLALTLALLTVGIGLADAEPIRFSTADRARYGSPLFEIERGDVGQYLTATNQGSLFFDGGSFANAENVDAFHLLPNGNVALSTGAEAHLGHPRVTFSDGTLVEYDMVADTTTVLLPESTFGVNSDIDAVHVRADGTYLLSTDNSSSIGTPPLAFLDGDIVHYDPVADTATLIFFESAFGSDEDIDALHEMPNGDLVLSIERPTGAALGGVPLKDGDLVAYRPSTGAATLFLSEGIFDEDANINALDLGCGNGILETGEDCDDGGESVACNADCTVASCGDGVVNATRGETCDDGNVTDGDGCDSNCTPTACGNGLITAGEDCDDGGESATCDADCTPAACGDGTVNGTAGDVCDDGNLTDGDGCDSNCTPTGCGNGVITAPETCDDQGESTTCDADCTEAVCGDGTTNATRGEACDDGNVADGDCCAAACTVEPAASPCPDDGDACTTVSECDGAGTCQHRAEPAVGCLLPAVPGKARLQVKNKDPDTKDTFKWKWLKGEVTTLADFGDPTTTDGYTLCVYDVSGATPVVVLRGDAPAGGDCGSEGKPRECWKSTKKGFRYNDRMLTPDGLQKIDLKEGAVPGKARVLVTGKGENIGMPTLPLPLPLRAQLHAGNGNCWEATYSELGVRKNRVEEFKGNSD